ARRAARTGTGVSRGAALRPKPYLPARPTANHRGYTTPGPKPRTGDQLLLVGSPYGLYGTVTTGIVSRVTPRAIQTDAAANPAIREGPRATSRGHLVGVLVSGAGENINFAIPISL